MNYILYIIKHIYRPIYLSVYIFILIYNNSKCKVGQFNCCKITNLPLYYIK